MSRYILGGGIAGLIFAFFNPQYKVITPEVGGQMSSPFPLGPRYLHYTDDSVALLTKLGLPIEMFDIKVGYIRDGQLIEPDKQFRRQYFLKSRGTKSLAGFDETVMNSNNGKFTALRVDFAELVKRLHVFVKDQIILEKATRINTRTKEIMTQGNRYKYEHLVSTMPKNVFLWLTGVQDLGYQSKPITYVLLRGDFADMNGYDFIYCVGKHRFHRLANAGEEIVADVVGELTDEEVHKEFGEFWRNNITLKNAQLVSSGKPIQAEGVTFFGRYGTWNRKWKTEYCIEQAKKFAETGEIDGTG